MSVEHRQPEKTTPRTHDRHPDQSQPNKESGKVLTSSNSWFEANHSPEQQQAAVKALENQNVLPKTEFSGSLTPQQLHAGQEAAQGAAKKDGQDLKVQTDEVKGRDAQRAESAGVADKIKAGYDAASAVTGGRAGHDHPLTLDEANNILKGTARDNRDRFVQPTKEQKQAIGDLVKNWDTPEAKAMQNKDKPGTFGDKSVADGRSSLDKQSADAKTADSDMLKKTADKQKSDEQDAKTLADAGKLRPDAAKALEVKSGEGPYQVAQRMLGLDGQKHTTDEVMKLTRQIQQQAKEENGGKAPKSFKAGPVVQSADKLTAKIASEAEAYKFSSTH